MKKKVEVVKGKIEHLRRVPTSTENPMITFTVGGTPCKAFGKGAETVARWMQIDPNIAGEFEGYFEKRSEKFGREFVAAHGKAIETEKIKDADRPATAVSGRGAAGAPSAPRSSGPVEPIPAKEPIGLGSEIAVEKAPTPLSHMSPAKAPLPADDFVRVEGVTFADLENQYKSQKLAHEIEELTQTVGAGNPESPGDFTPRLPA
jgi:hypothetical protein